MRRETIRKKMEFLPMEDEKGSHEKNRLCSLIILPPTLLSICLYAYLTVMTRRGIITDRSLYTYPYLESLGFICKMLTSVVNFVYTISFEHFFIKIYIPSTTYSIIYVYPVSTLLEFSFYRCLKNITEHELWSEVWNFRLLVARIISFTNSFKGWKSGFYNEESSQTSWMTLDIRNLDGDFDKA